MLLEDVLQEHAVFELIPRRVLGCNLVLGLGDNISCDPLWKNDQPVDVTKKSNHRSRP